MTDQFQALNAAQTLVDVAKAKFDADEGENSDAEIDNLVHLSDIFRSTSDGCSLKQLRLI